MRKLNRWIGIVIISLLLTLATGCGETVSQADEAVPVANQSKRATVIVKFLDIGQGDAILIKTPSQVTLVDSGDVSAREKLIVYLRNEGVKVIDNVIITHPHADHIGGMKAVFDNFTVKHVYDSGQASTSQLYTQYLSEIKAKKILFTVVTDGMNLDLGTGVVMNFFGPIKPFITASHSDANNNSIVGKLIYNNFTLLLTGDAEQEEEKAILGRHAKELKSNILKSGHHGSNTASSVSFLKAVSPEAAVISCGINNPYHHPHPSTIKKYEQQSINIFTTAKNGTITVTSDGQGYTINKEKL